MENDKFINPTDPVFEKAMELAREFSLYCKENNLPDSFVVMGVAHNADTIYRNAYEEGYIEGKAYEKCRISELLGIAT